MTCHRWFASVFLLFIVGCGEAPVIDAEVVRPLRVMKIGDVQAMSGRSFPGRAAALQEVNLSFRVGGPLIAFPVEIGDEVEIDDVLARIDPRDYEVQILNVEGELDKANAEYTLAEREYQRAVEAQKKGPDLISESEIDRRLGARDRSRANVKALEASLQAARDELEYTYLRTPFPGTVVNTYVENFEDVRFKQPILRVLDTTKLEFTINIPETLMSSLSSVRNLRVRYDAFPDLEVPAQLKEIGTEASEATRTYPVTLVMDPPEDAKILPGMAGKATGEVVGPADEEEFKVVVPVTAVFSPEAGGTSNVWILDESANTVSRREVQAGTLITGGIRIESGLNSGEVIAVAGTHFLRDGQKIRPVFD